MNVNGITPDANAFNHHTSGIDHMFTDSRKIGARAANESVTSTTASSEIKTETDGKSAATDTVEISQEARDLLESQTAAETEKPWSMIEYETALVRDSKEEKNFRDLMKNVKTQKSDLMSRINDIFKENGISQKDLGKVKIEVDHSGKIVVGGVRDPKTAKALEKALNEDKSFGKQLLQFQHDEKELSRQLKEYTGCSLYELAMTQRGDINGRIRSEVEETMGEFPPTDDFYSNLGFLGENLNHVVGAQDIAELSFNGPIDFSGETNVLADPEGNIKKELESMNQDVLEECNKHNKEVMERMEAAGITMTDEMRAKYLLDPTNVKIEVDKNGAITIKGAFSQNADNNKKGESIANQMVQKMLTKTNENSYHTNIFTAAHAALALRD